MAVTRTYGTLALQGPGWVMSGVPPHVAIRLKQLFPRIPKHQTGTFAFPTDEMTTADLVWFTSRYPMVMSEADATEMRRKHALFESNQAELGRILMPDFTPPGYLGLRPGQTIRPYQAQAIEMVARRRGLLLGDDLGLGKTYVAGGFLLTPGACPAAVVMQVHLQRQWFEKLTTFTSLRVHMVKTTKPYDLPPADVYLFRYSQLAGWVDVFGQGVFKSVVFDEVQELRTGSASFKGGAAISLADHAEYRLGLSATPIYNYGSEIWNILRCIDQQVLGPWGDFLREWCTASGQHHVVQDPEALGSYLREQHVFLRRTKRDVGQQVPPVNRLVESIPCDQKAMDAIEELARSLALKVATGSFIERGRAALELDLMVRQATGVGKARHVAAYVRLLLEAKVPVVLAGWHREVYATWLRELADFKPVMYTGSESATQKDAAVRAFLAGETNLFILSLRSGAGLDGLQHRCSTVVFGELDWSGKVHEQVIGRLDREGQAEQVTAIYLNTDQGSDPPMIELLGLKASQATGITDPGRVFEAVHSDESRVKALARQFLDRKAQQALDGPPPAPEQPAAAVEPPRQVELEI